MDVKKELKTRSAVPGVLISFFKMLSPSVLRHPLNFILSLALSRAVVLGGSAPFGLAAAAAVSAGPGSLWGLLGAVIGYLSIIDRVNSLKYMACITLIFTAHFVFSDTSLSRHRAFVPLSVIVPASCIDLVFLADAGFPIFDCSLAVFEITLASVSAVLFNTLKNKKLFGTQIFSYGLLALCAVVSMALSELVLFGVFSAGHVFALALIMLSAHVGGISAGAVVGISFGFAISLAKSSADYCMIYGVLGLTASAFASKNKFFTLIGVPPALFCALCLNPEALISQGSELLLSAALFLAFSGLFSKYARRLFISSAPRRDIHIRTYAAERLHLASSAFASLGRLVGDGREQKPLSAISEKQLFERASRETCKKCTLRDICWKRDYEGTRDALNNASEAIQKNGALETRDFPIHFSSRCMHIESFTNTVNREIFAQRFKNQYNGQIRESRELMRKQYSDAASVFAALEAEIADNARFDEEAEIKLGGLFSSFGVLCDIAVYRDSRNHINLHLCGKDLGLIVREFERFSPAISAAVGCRISAPQYVHGDALDDLIIRELPPLRAVFGAAVKRKGGSEVSGDSGSFFRPMNGHIALLLSDGMGSGRLAALESAASVKLLEELLKSGISPESALGTIHSALTLRAEHTSAFSTLDLLYADLFTGNTEIYKFGGAPTYIKRGRQIKRITASSLPAGMNIGSPAAPDKTALTLCEGDFIVMTSDGTVDANEDTQLVEFLSKSDEASPKALADSLLAYSLAVYKKNDDMTVAVVRIEREE